MPSPIRSQSSEQALELADSLKSDLKTERAMVIGAALAADPALAQDLLLFKAVADLLGRGGSVAPSLGVSASGSSWRAIWPARSYCHQWNLAQAAGAPEGPRKSSIIDMRFPAWYRQTGNCMQERTAHVSDQG